MASGVWVGGVGVWVGWFGLCGFWGGEGGWGGLGVVSGISGLLRVWGGLESGAGRFHVFFFGEGGGGSKIWRGWA